MQITQLYTVYDSKAEVFLPPFFVPTRGIAMRAFEDCVNSPDHQFGKHPGDYTLFFLGLFDDTDASFALETKKSLGNGVEYLRAQDDSGEQDAPHTSIQPDKNGRDSSEFIRPESRS